MGPDIVSVSPKPNCLHKLWTACQKHFVAHGCPQFHQCMFIITQAIMLQPWQTCCEQRWLLLRGSPLMCSLAHNHCPRRGAQSLWSMPTRSLMQDSEAFNQPIWFKIPSINNIGRGGGSLANSRNGFGVLDVPLTGASVCFQWSMPAEFLSRLRNGNIFLLNAVAQMLVPFACGSMLSGRHHSFVDSTAAQFALVKGFTSDPAVNVLSSIFWAAAAEIGAGPCFERVTSKSNPVDATSRGDCSHAVSMGVWEICFDFTEVWLLFLSTVESHRFMDATFGTHIAQFWRWSNSGCTKKEWQIVWRSAATASDGWLRRQRWVGSAATPFRRLGHRPLLLSASTWRARSNPLFFLKWARVVLVLEIVIVVCVPLLSSLHSSGFWSSRFDLVVFCLLVSHLHSRHRHRTCLPQGILVQVRNWLNWYSGSPNNVWSDLQHLGNLWAQLMPMHEPCIEDPSFFVVCLLCCQHVSSSLDCFLFRCTHVVALVCVSVHPENTVCPRTLKTLAEKKSSTGWEPINHFVTETHVEHTQESVNEQRFPDDFEYEWRHHRSDAPWCVPKTSRSLWRRRLVVLSEPKKTNLHWNDGNGETVKNKLKEARTANPKNKLKGATIAKMKNDQFKWGFNCGTRKDHWPFWRNRGWKSQHEWRIEIVNERNDDFYVTGGVVCFFQKLFIALWSLQRIRNHKWRHYSLTHVHRRYWSHVVNICKWQSRQIFRGTFAFQLICCREKIVHGECGYYHRVKSDRLQMTWVCEQRISHVTFSCWSPTLDVTSTLARVWCATHISTPAYPCADFVWCLFFIDILSFISLVILLIFVNFHVGDKIPTHSWKWGVKYFDWKQSFHTQEAETNEFLDDKLPVLSEELNTRFFNTRVQCRI